MKRYFALASALLLIFSVGAHAQALDEQYVQIFGWIQEADSLSSTQPGKALAKYAEAQTALQRIQKASPDWNPKVVSFRLTYIANRISALSTTPASESATNAPPQTNAPPATNAQPATNAPPTTNPPPAEKPTNAPPAAQQPSAPPNAEMEAQVRLLREQVRQLQTDRIMMEAKLKEALAMQPAEADAGEMARAQEKLKTLQKENDLLKASLDSEKSKSGSVPDTKGATTTQAEANRQLAQQKDLIARLTVERDALQARVKSGATMGGADLAALQAENQMLKQQLASTKAPSPSKSAPAPGKAEGQGTLAQAQAEIATLQSDKELLRLEKVALENRLKQLGTNAAPAVALSQSAATPAATATVTTTDNSHVRQLELERNELQKKLDIANKALVGKKGTAAAAARVQQLEVDLSAARARLEVFEARQVPYSAEELALMKTPETKLAEATPKSTKRPTRDLPSGSTRLVTEAQAWFASRQYDKAETAYTQVVQMDPKNVPALGNLAAIETEAGHFEAAERHIQAALAEDPDDAFTLYILGILKFRETKFDDALNALSRAAKLDPDNAEIQNYLGLALSEKGMRGPAETALRKAIQLQPNYGGAHYNLAIVYLSQQPAAVELARWHYQKALSTGHPRNSEVEQKLGAK